MSIPKALTPLLIFLGFSVSAIADINSEENYPTITPVGAIEYGEDWIRKRIDEREQEAAQAESTRFELDSLLSEVTGMPLGMEKDLGALASLQCELDEAHPLQAYTCGDNTIKFAALTFDSAHRLVGAYFSLTTTDQERTALITKFEDKLGSAKKFTKTIGPETSSTFFDSETQQLMAVEYQNGIMKASWTWLDQDWEDWELEIQAEGYSDLYVMYKSPKQYSGALAEAKGLSIYLDALYEFLDELGSLLFPLIFVFLGFVTTQDGWRKHYDARKARKQKDRAAFIKDGRDIMFLCALVTLLMSAGGPICESGDIYGCDYFSDDYREPIAGPEVLKLFLEILLSALTGYWLAYFKWKKNQ